MVLFLSFVRERCKIVLKRVTCARIIALHLRSLSEKTETKNSLRQDNKPQELLYHSSRAERYLLILPIERLVQVAALFRSLGTITSSVGQNVNFPAVDAQAHCRRLSRSCEPNTFSGTFFTETSSRYEREIKERRENKSASRTGERTSASGLSTNA